MATNSSRGNTIAAADGPPKETSMPVPPVPSDLKAEIAQQQGPDKTSKSGASAGLHDSGQDAASVAPGAYVETVGDVEGSGKAGEGKETS